jgi:2-polyprenyl-6-methoxyphenol hydroxylase-like FAD-dependent oxidoreductase
MKPLHIAIVGYGTAGQAAAVLLSRDGHRVEAFERAAQPGPVGAGLLLQPTGLQVLWQMDLLRPALLHGAPVRRLYGEARAGRTVMDMRYAGLDAQLYGIGMQRGALFSLLAEALPDQASLHCDAAIETVDAIRGFVRDANGREHGPFELVIAADGAASRLRAHVCARGIDRPYPWGALWCLLPAGDWLWRDELRQRYVAARKMIGLLPVGTRPGDDVARLSFFWSLPVADFDAWHRRGAQAWLQEVAQLWPEAHALLSHEDVAARLLRASYRDAVPTRWHRDRLVLLGDAAHAMSPQLGQGVNMALLDALALRDALRAQTGITAALAQYEQARRRHVAIYHFWSRWLTPLFQSEHDTVARLRDLAMLPLGRFPGGSGHMLRVLSGTQHGWLGRLGLDPAFVAALAVDPVRA